MHIMHMDTNAMRCDATQCSNYKALGVGCATSHRRLGRIVRRQPWLTSDPQSLKQAHLPRRQLLRNVAPSSVDALRKLTWSQARLNGPQPGAMSAASRGRQEQHKLEPLTASTRVTRALTRDAASYLRPLPSLAPKAGTALAAAANLPAPPGFAKAQSPARLASWRRSLLSRRSS